MQYKEKYIIKMDKSFEKIFANECIKRGIPFNKLKDLKTENLDDGCCQNVLIEVGRKDFLNVKKVFLRYKENFKIIKKYGLQKYLSKMHDMKVLLICVVLTFWALWEFSTRIWMINVDGIDKEKNQRVFEVLESNYIYNGIKKKEVVTDKVKNLIYENCPDVLFVSIDINGTYMNIHILNKKSNYMNDDKKYNSIVASKDAVVKKVIVSKGNGLIKKDELVKKGQLLIEGAYPIVNNQGEEVWENTGADGKVLGKATYEIMADCDLNIEEKVYTGRKKYCFSINGLKMGFPFFLFKKLKECDSSKYTCKINKNILNFEVLNEFEMKTREIDKETAKKILLDKIKEKVGRFNYKVYDVYDLKEDFFKIGDKFYLKGLITTLEDIGVKE